jgi:hypothetical protein
MKKLSVILIALSLFLTATACGTRQQIQRLNLNGIFQVQNSRCEEFYRFMHKNQFNHIAHCYNDFRKLDTSTSFVRRGIFTENSDTTTITYTDRGKDDDKIVYLIFRSNRKVVTLTNLDNHDAIVLKRVGWIPKIKTTLNQDN